jgi:hypothetical protein
VPDALHEQVKNRAQAEKRSLSAEVIVLLQRGLDAERRVPGSRQMSVTEILEEMRRGREGRAWDGVDSVQLIREARGSLVD